MLYKKNQKFSLISYADRRYSIGNVYNLLSFEKKETTKSNYIWANGFQVFSRYQCQKHRLSKILGDKFNPELSETESMTLKGL